MGLGSKQGPEPPKVVLSKLLVTPIQKATVNLQGPNNLTSQVGSIWSHGHLSRAPVV